MSNQTLLEPVKNVDGQWKTEEILRCWVPTKDNGVVKQGFHEQLKL